MNARLLFNSSAMIEALTGISILVAPSWIVELLLGDGLDPTGVGVARVLGIGLLAIGVAGWQSQGRDAQFAPRAGLLIYNVGSAAVLATLGTTGGMNGILLWPVAVLHALLGAIMTWVTVVSYLLFGRKK